VTADLLHLPRASQIAELERRLAAGGLEHLPPDLRRVMSGSRHRPRREPPPCATLALSNEHYVAVMAAATALAPDLRGTFFEAVALALREVPVTDEVVVAAIERTLQALLGCTGHSAA
jgi:hypothetical protein